MSLFSRSLAAILCLVFLLSTSSCHHVAIIGAGISGSASAYFLRHLLGNATDITVYEKDLVGGRMATVEVGGQTFEAGASVIHPSNKHMATFASVLGLKHLTGGSGNGMAGFFNGDTFRYLETGHPTKDKIKLFLRYGLSLERMSSLITDMLKHFSSIYDLQQYRQSFKTVPELLDAMHEGVFHQMTQETGAEYLFSKDISALAINELVATTTRVNYGQNTTMNAFATSVSMAGSEGSLWSIEGGNKLVCEGLIQLADAYLVRETVETVERVVQGGTVSYRLLTTSGSSRMFDAVILAAPLQLANISFTGFSSPPKPPSGTYYQRTVATFVKGQPRGSYVGLGNLSEAAFPDLVMTVENESLAFSCIGRNDPVTGEAVRGDSVWKVFSRSPLSESVLDAMFVRRFETVVKEWQAYPHYMPPDQFVPFVLDERLFHTNTIEWAASAMEMGAIAGYNAAILTNQALQDLH